ncbi:MAG: hypothetical protein JXM79_08765 [Sedimentisphaerales bacterium]|nr:hypothetical protein [Sedimentisphaerales bacterium]
MMYRHLPPFFKNLLQNAILNQNRLQPLTAILLVQSPEQNKPSNDYLYQINYRCVKDNFDSTAYPKGFYDKNRIP